MDALALGDKKVDTTESYECNHHKGGHDGPHTMLFLFFYYKRSFFHMHTIPHRALSTEIVSPLQNHFCFLFAELVFVEREALFKRSHRSGFALYLTHFNRSRFAFK